MRGGILLSALLFAQCIAIFSIYSNEIDDVYEVEEECDKGICRFKNAINLPSNNLLQTQQQPQQLPSCIDRVNQCAEYKRQGKCEKEPGEMSFNCPVTCNFCHLMDPKVRCDKARMNVSTTPSVPTGGLNKLFNKIVDNFSNTYDITVLSKDPWVITFDNFLTDEEVAGFLVATNNSIDTWSKSVEFTGSDSFGNAHRTETQARTSTSLWCDSDTCTNHPSTRSISRKISELLGMPNVERQSESFQVSCI
jgi:hypothetical protein